MKFPAFVPVSRDLGSVAQPFMSLQREIDRLFDDFARGFPNIDTLSGGNGGMLMPSTNVAETDKEIEITAELPGLEEKDVQVNLADVGSSP